MSRLTFTFTSDSLPLSLIGGTDCKGPLLGGPEYIIGGTPSASLFGTALRSYVTLTLKGATTETITILVGDTYITADGGYNEDGDPGAPELGSLYWNNSPSWGSRGKVTITTTYDSGLSYTAGPSDAVVGDGNATIDISESGLITAGGQTYQIPAAYWNTYDITAITWGTRRAYRYEDHGFQISTATGGTTRNTTGGLDNYVFEGVTQSWSGSWFDGAEGSSTTSAPSSDVTIVAETYQYLDTPPGTTPVTGACTLTNNAASGDPLYDYLTGSTTPPSPVNKLPDWTASKSLLQQIGDNVTVLPTGAELVIRPKRSGSNQVLACHRRAGYDQTFAEVATVGSAAATLKRPFGASAGERYVVRQAPTASQVSEDHGETFAQVNVSDPDPLVLALRTETLLLAFKLDPADGLMCGVRLSSGNLVAVDQDGDTATVATSVGAQTEAVVFRNGNGTWEIVAIDGGDLTSYTSDGVGVQGWTAATPQTLDSPAADVQYLANWRTRAGLDVIAGYSAAAGGYRVWYREGAGQSWSNAVAVASSAPGAAPYLYERPTGQLELGALLAGTWYAWTAEHPAGTWSAV